MVFDSFPADSCFIEHGHTVINVYRRKSRFFGQFQNLALEIWVSSDYRHIIRPGLTIYERRIIFNFLRLLLRNGAEKYDDFFRFYTKTYKEIRQMIEHSSRI